MLTCATRCDLCCLSFRTHRGMLRHNAGVHKILPQDPSGRPFIQNNPSIPTGFNDLAFIDFSCKKFAHIAQVAARHRVSAPPLYSQDAFNRLVFAFQVWCETNLRRCISKFHRFVCDCCDKAFPLRSALDLHKTISHRQEPGADDAGETGEDRATENGVEEGRGDEKQVLCSEQAGFLEGLGLQHVSKVSIICTAGCRPTPKRTLQFLLVQPVSS